MTLNLKDNLGTNVGDSHAFITIEGMAFGYPDKAPIFQGFDWHVQKGQSWAIIGPSGCGKTTLLYLLAGLRYPTAGKVLIESRTVTGPRASTGLILQDYGLLPWASVRDNVALGLKLRGASIKDKDERTSYWLSKLGIENVAEHFVSQVSGGQRQRTAIARTLALDPQVLLMDEPFSSLDALIREGLQDLIVGLRRTYAVTTIVVTHNIEEAVFLGEQILVLGKGPAGLPMVVKNLSSGNLDYRFQEEFHRKCSEVRQALEGQQS